MANIKAMTGHLDNDSRPLQENYNKRTQLNTYIYEYFLHNEMFQCAESILKADSGVSVQGHRSGSVRKGKGYRLKNALRDKTTDTHLDSANSNLLPAPNIPNPLPDSCFLYEWFCLFWAIFNAQKNQDARIEANQYAGNMQKQNWPRWSASLSQAHSPLLLHNTPDSATGNAFCNSEDKDVSSITPYILGSQAWGRSKEVLQQFRMQSMSMEQQNENELTGRQGRSSLLQNDGTQGGWGGQGPIQSSKRFQRPALQSSKPEPLPITKKSDLGTQPRNKTALNLSEAETEGIGSKQSDVRTTQQPVATKETASHQEGKIDNNGPVRWQNESSENQITCTTQHGVQCTLQERSRCPLVRPADANNSDKTGNTIPSPSQTRKAALPTQQLSKAAREKGPSPKRTIPKKRTMNGKDEVEACKIPKLNVGSTATRPAHAAPSPVPHINPAGIWKDAQNTSLSQVVPTGQPAVALPLTLVSMAANPPVDLVQSATFSVETSSDFASLPTFDSDLHDFDIDAFLASSAEDVGELSPGVFSI